MRGNVEETRQNLKFANLFQGSHLNFMMPSPLRIYAVSTYNHGIRHSYYSKIQSYFNNLLGMIIFPKYRMNIVCNAMTCYECS